MADDNEYKGFQKIINPTTTEHERFKIYLDKYVWTSTLDHEDL